MYRPTTRLLVHSILFRHFHQHFQHFLRHDDERIARFRKMLIAFEIGAPKNRRPSFSENKKMNEMKWAIYLKEKKILKTGWYLYVTCRLVFLECCHHFFMIFYLVMCLPVKMFELIILLFYSPFFFLCLIIFVAVLPEPACLVCLIRLPYINPPLQMPGLEWRVHPFSTVVRIRTGRLPQPPYPTTASEPMVLPR